MTSPAPKITFYTNPGSPWAHRVQIALRELGLPYEERIVSLQDIKEDWYKQINPRSLIPSLTYVDEAQGVTAALTESAVISRFLLDAHPSHLTPSPDRAGSLPGAALARARANFFVDTYFAKVYPPTWALFQAADASVREAHVAAILEAVDGEIEPLLRDAAPFFGGSSELTAAEVLAAPFALRLTHFADGVIFPESLREGLEKREAWRRWVEACGARESVTGGWDLDEGRRQIHEDLKARFGR